MFAVCYSRGVNATVVLGRRLQVQLAASCFELLLCYVFRKRRHKDMKRCKKMKGQDSSSLLWPMTTKMTNPDTDGRDDATSKPANKRTTPSKQKRRGTEHQSEDSQPKPQVQNIDPKKQRRRENKEIDARALSWVRRERRLTIRRPRCSRRDGFSRATASTPARTAG